MKEISIGRESFAKLILNNNYYVDKTPFIKTVFQKEQSDVLLITRPRRFGKTLTMNTFYEFLRLNPKDPNNSEDTSYQESLFKNTKIYEDKEFCQEHMGKFPVIFITLKDVVGDTYDLAYNQLAGVIVELISTHFLYLLSSDKLSDIAKIKLLKMSDEQYFFKGVFVSNTDLKKYDSKDEKSEVKNTLQGALRFLTECLSKHHGVKPIVLIDEYDVPISKAAHYGYYNKIIPLVSSFLSKCLKSNSFLGKAVLTGCLRAAKESIFTGLNNLKVSSVLDRNNLELSSGIGFTKEETLEVLTYYKLDKFHDMVTENYDGYYFGREHMYCPWDVMNFCSDNYRNVGEYEDEIIAENYWINTSGNDVIEEYMGYIDPKDIDQMQALVNRGPITTSVRPSLCYGDLHSHNIEDFWTLLLYTGYLTFDPKSVKEDTNGGTVCDLYIPNNEITSCFRSKILNYYKNNPEIQNCTRELTKALFNGDSESVQKNINSLLIKYVSIRDFTTKAPKENYYHGFLNGVLASGTSEIYEQHSNMESGDGYVDLLLTSLSETDIVILELKQTSSLADDRNVIAANAIQQIKDNRYAEPYMNTSSIKNIYAYGVCFYKKQSTVVMEKLK